MGCCFLVVLVVFFRPYCFAFAVFVRGAACLAEMGSLPSGCNYQSQNSVFFIFSGFFFFSFAGDLVHIGTWQWVLKKKF